MKRAEQWIFLVAFICCGPLIAVGYLYAVAKMAFLMGKSLATKCLIEAKGGTR